MTDKSENASRFIKRKIIKAIIGVVIKMSMNTRCGITLYEKKII